MTINFELEALMEALEQYVDARIEYNNYFQANPSQSKATEQMDLKWGYKLDQSTQKLYRALLAYRGGTEQP